MLFFIFTDGYALCVICGLPEQSFPCGTSFHRENNHGSHENEIASFGATVIIIYLILQKNHNAIFNVTFFLFLKNRLLKDIDEKGEYIIKIRLEEWTCKIKV